MTASIVVSVAELQRAWRALRAGDFTAGQPPAASPWRPTEPVLPVLGAVGGGGASTVALAVATAAGSPARLVECAPGAGLVAASTTELGLVDGWRRGRRGPVLLDRPGPAAGRGLPPPPDTDQPLRLTVLDVGTLAPHPRGWLAGTGAAAPVVLVVAPATVPGLRGVEVLLGLRHLTDRAVLALVGLRGSGWPRPLRPVVGPLTGRVAGHGRLVGVPWDAGLHRRGVGGAELPGRVLAAAAGLLGAVAEMPGAGGWSACLDDAEEGERA